MQHFTSFALDECYRSAAPPMMMMRADAGRPSSAIMGAPMEMISAIMGAAIRKKKGACAKFMLIGKQKHLKVAFPVFIIVYCFINHA